MANGFALPHVEGERPKMAQNADRKAAELNKKKPAAKKPAAKKTAKPKPAKAKPAARKPAKAKA